MGRRFAPPLRSVVEEPLPDSFAQLLDKLDGDEHG
jgi:hypothetical protein